MIASLRRVLRLAQLCAGVGVFLLGAGLALHFRMSDCCPNRNRQVWADAFFFFLLVSPGFLVAWGSFLQTLRYKQWGLMFVLVGTLGVIHFIAPSVASLYVYREDNWGQVAGVTDLLLVSMTLLLGLINAIFQARSLKPA